MAKRSADQIDMFVAHVETPEESAEEREHRYYDMRGRAFELYCEAGECSSEKRRDELLRRVEELEQQARAILKGDGNDMG